MSNKNLNVAKTAKNDEFYTQMTDIEKEIQAYIDYNPDVFRGKTILCPCDDPDRSNFTKFFMQNFSRFRLKKLISTSYATDAEKIGYTKPLFGDDSDDESSDNLKLRGRIFSFDNENCLDSIDIDNLHWEYLSGSGDFRSDEVTKLRDEADVIITNPPFSLFREFIKWISNAKDRKLFSIIGNMNAITYTFSMIKEGKMWLDPSISSGDREFQVPDDYPLKAAGFRINEEGNHFIRVKGIRWFTNIENGRRHEPLSLMTMSQPPTS